MKTKRIVACLDIDKGRVVKGVNFVNLVDAGDPVEIAKAYELQGADELVLLDIKASYEKRGILLDLVKKIGDEITIPFTVGGGIKSVEDFKQVIQAGADKVSIGSAAVKTPSIIKECAGEFGSPAVVVAIDVKQDDNGDYHVYIRGGRENTGLGAVAWAKEVEALGAGEILLTSMGKDGTKSGYDLSISKKISRAVKIPIIASGGAGKKEDFYNVFTQADADGALAASLFHFKEIDIRDLKEYLYARGIQVRR